MKLLWNFMFIFSFVSAMERNNSDDLHRENSIVIDHSPFSSESSDSLANMAMKLYEERHNSSFSEQIRPYVLSVIEQDSSPLSPNPQLHNLVPRVRSQDVSFPSQKEIIESIISKALYKAFEDHHALMEKYKRQYDSSWSKKKAIIINAIVTGLSSGFVGLMVHFLSK